MRYDCAHLFRQLHGIVNGTEDGELLNEPHEITLTIMIRDYTINTEDFVVDRTEITIPVIFQE